MFQQMKMDFGILQTKLHRWKAIKTNYDIGLFDNLWLGVSDQETYPSVLQKLIQPKNPDYEVVNGGQPGFTSFQGLWFWNKILKKLYS